MSNPMWSTLRRQSQMVATQEVSSRELVSAHFDQIDVVNPDINAIITEDRDRAFREAREADEITAHGEGRGALHGIPMTHKDTHETAGMRTTFGSPLFADHVPSRDSLVVERMRAAGVITTGKSNVPELAAGSNTFNTLFGETRNPYDLAKTAGGSSGGVGAAIAAGIQPAGDGSDMGGSVRTPASFNNIVGFRPTNGHIPHAYPENPWSWLAQTGLMARSVGDIAFLMDIVSGPHRLAPLSRPSMTFDLPEFDPDEEREPSLSGFRVGFSEDLAGRLNVEPEVLETVGNAAGVLESLGAYVSADVPDLDGAAEVFSIERAHEFACLFGVSYEESPEKFKDFVGWNVQLGLDLTSRDYRLRDTARALLHSRIVDFFDEHDVLVTTTSQVLPFDVDTEYPTSINGVTQSDYLDWMRAATLFSATGCPAVSVPAGFSGGLPVGIQIVGAPGDDLTVLRAARAFEAATGYGATRPPSPVVSGGVR